MSYVAQVRSMSEHNMTLENFRMLSCYAVQIVTTYNGQGWRALVVHTKFDDRKDQQHTWGMIPMDTLTPGYHVLARSDEELSIFEAYKNLHQKTGEMIAEKYDVEKGFVDVERPCPYCPPPSSMPKFGLPMYGMPGEKKAPDCKCTHEDTCPKKSKGSAQATEEIPAPAVAPSSPPAVEPEKSCDDDEWDLVSAERERKEEGSAEPADVDAMNEADVAAALCCGCVTPAVLEKKSAPCKDAGIPAIDEPCSPIGCICEAPAVEATVEYVVAGECDLKLAPSPPVVDLTARGTSKKAKKGKKAKKNSLFKLSPPRPLSPQPPPVGLDDSLAPAGDSCLRSGFSKKTEESEDEEKVAKGIEVFENPTVEATPMAANEEVVNEVNPMVETLAAWGSKTKKLKKGKKSKKSMMPIEAPEDLGEQPILEVVCEATVPIGNVLEAVCELAVPDIGPEEAAPEPSVGPWGFGGATSKRKKVGKKNSPSPEPVVDETPVEQGFRAGRPIVVEDPLVEDVFHPAEEVAVPADSRPARPISVVTNSTGVSTSVATRSTGARLVPTFLNLRMEHSDYRVLVSLEPSSTIDSIIRKGAELYAESHFVIGIGETDSLSREIDRLVDDCEITSIRIGESVGDFRLDNEGLERLLEILGKGTEIPEIKIEFLGPD